MRGPLFFIVILKSVSNGCATDLRSPYYKIARKRRYEVAMEKTLLKPAEKLLLRPAEVGGMTGFGKSKTYALIAAGVIPSVRVGKSVRVPADRLRRWIEELQLNEQTPPRTEPSTSLALPGKRAIPVPPSVDGARTVKRRSQNPQKSEEP